MKKHLALLLFLLAPAVLLAQEEEEWGKIEYKSKEKDEYYRERVENYQPWKPLDKSEILNYTNAFLKSRKLGTIHGTLRRITISHTILSI